MSCFLIPPVPNNQQLFVPPIYITFGYMSSYEILTKAFEMTKSVQVGFLAGEKIKYENTCCL